MSMTERFGHHFVRGSGGRPSRFHLRRTMPNTLVIPFAAPGDASDSAKRRQIIEGARAVFLSQGFDAASMNDIARKAGVSKGTLYVYFKSKEDLFEAITEEQCRFQAERVFELDGADHDVEAVLRRLGGAFAHYISHRSTS